MAQSDRFHRLWTRTVGFCVWIAAGIALLGPMTGVLVQDCFWEQGCESPQAPRFLGALIIAFGLAFPIGWAAVALLGRLFGRSGSKVR